MDPILSLLDSTIGARQARMLGVLLVFLPIFFFAYWAVKRGARFVLRPIAGYAALRGALAFEDEPSSFEAALEATKETGA